MSSRTNNRANTRPSGDASEPGVRPVRRRGSALVLVVGTLALIAVFAAFYVTLGQSDTRVSRGVEEGGAVEEVERQFALSIAEVVGADRLATYTETITDDADDVGPRFDADNNPVTSIDPNRPEDRQRFLREVTDYPYTDYTKVSIVSDGLGSLPQDADLQFRTAPYGNKPAIFNGNAAAAVEPFRFRPAGDESFMLDLPGAFDAGLSINANNPNALADRRVASDPWLASNEPTFTGRADPQNLANGGFATFLDRRIFSQEGRRLSGNTVTQEELFYLDNRDWAQISNPAPDGLSVNLWNLRNNFDAESGLGLDASNRPRMSENRTLLTVMQDGTFRLRASDRLHIDPTGAATPSILGPANSPNANATTFAIKNTPAWWTMNQRFLYFPADPSFQILGRDDTSVINLTDGNVVPQTPDRPDHPDLQYADADGDGFYDSRWYELRDSTLGPNGVLDLLANETGMRFFFAPRIIDLSAKVNVNSATDGLVPPTSEVPAGATPAEIDLRRLLMMSDQAERFAPVFPNPNAGITDERLSYTHIQRLPFNEAQAGPGNANRFIAADYERYATGYDPAVIANGWPNGMFPLTGAGVSTGRFAYDAIRRAIQGDQIALPAEMTSDPARAGSPLGGGVIAPLEQSSPFEYYLFDPSVLPQDRNIRVGLNSNDFTLPTLAEIRRMPAARRDYWHFVGGSNIADPNDPPLTALGIGGNLFDLEDLAELLTFHGLNDDRVLSRLERVTQGRFDDPGAPSPTTRFGPLRANRPTALERGFHDDRLNTVPPAGGGVGLTSDNRIDHESLALTALNPRLRLTTLSGAAPLRSRVVEDTNGDGILSADEKRLTAADARLDLTANPTAQDLFAIYSDALLPYSFVDATWAFDPDGDQVLFGSGPDPFTSYNEHRTLAYGHRGSELALRLSAHLSVNMADQLDADDTPTAMTVLAAAADSSSLSNGWTRNELGTAVGAPQDASYPWWSQDDRFDLGDDRLAPQGAELDITGGADLSRQAYNVFGLEAQPVITEVTLLTVYNDTPRTLLQNPTPTSSGGYADFPAADLAETESEGNTPWSAVPGGNYEDAVDASLYNGAFLFPPNCGIGADDGIDDNILIQYDVSPNNPDLMLQVLAVQLTNPFDVPINLSDDEDPVRLLPNATNPVDAIDTNGELLPGAPTRLEDARFYLEYNGHFFALADFVENPLLTQGIYDQPQQANRLHRVVLQPGESRVFYVSAHPDLTDLSIRWRQVIEAYPNAGDLGESFAVSDAIPTTATDPDLVQKFVHDQFAVRRSARDISDPMLAVNPNVSLPVRMVPFNPETGDVRPAGQVGGQLNLNLDPTAFVDVTRTNTRFRQYVANATDYARLRQEVRLWRKMTIDRDTNTLDGIEGETYTGTNPGDNWIGNDLLVDRLRDPALDAVTSVSNEAALDYATMQSDTIQTRIVGDFYNENGNFGEFDFSQPTVRDERSIPLTMSNDDTVGGWSLLGGTNQGATIVRWAGYRRPDHLEEADGDGLLNDKDRSPRGLLPAWCIEGIGTNHNIAVPTAEDKPDGIDGLRELQEEVFDTQFQAGRPAGNLFGFRGCHGGNIGLNSDTRGMFFMNFRRFMLEHVPLRNISDGLEPGFILANQGINGQVKYDPMIIPTITRHPALKYRRVELINEINDFDGLGGPDEFQDPLDHRTIFRNIPGTPQFEPTDKRTIARLNAEPQGEPRDIIAELPIALSVGTDGLGDDGDGLTSTDEARLKPVRVGDLLTPFAFGAMYAPLDPVSGRFPRNFLPEEWMTFTEAASAGLGFEPAAFYTLEPDQPNWDLLSETIDNKGRRNSRQVADSLTVATQIYERMNVLDLGRLDLHGFAPFVNRTEPLTSGNPLASEPQFDPLDDPTNSNGNLLFSDSRVGLAQPPAQRLLSLATALSRGGDPLTTPLIGTVNLNTAPDAVLRTVPGFATSLQFSPSGVEYDIYNADGSDLIPNGDLMDWPVGRVRGKTANEFVEPNPTLTGEPWAPAFGVSDPFGNFDAERGVFDPAYLGVGDLPASLLAWRDRTRAAFRRPARFNPEVGQGGFVAQGRQPESVYDFTPNRAIANGFINAPPMWPLGGDNNDILSLTLNNFATDYSRNAISGQNASSEQPGLSGVGSILGLTVTRFDPLADNPQTIANPRVLDPTNPAASNWRLSVYEAVPQGAATRHGTDGFAMEAIDQDWNGEADTNPLLQGDEVTLELDDQSTLPYGVTDNYSYTLGRGRYLNENPDLLNRQRALEDEVVDDILEELAILNGAANAVDVRSDFFAAWFLLRGYREDDVQGLEPGEPMRPTYEKRFLMVLDRSNVTEAGQLPRVLFVREVPL